MATKQTIEQPAEDVDPGDALIGKFANDQIALQQAKDALFFRLADNDGLPTTEDTALLVALQMKPREVEHEVHRARRVRRLQAVAQTAEDRETANAIAGEAEADRDATVPKLRAKIAELEREVRQLEERASELRSAADNMEKARQQLRDHVPEFVRLAVSRQRGALRSLYAAQIAPLRETITIAATAASLRPASRPNDRGLAIDLAKRHGRTVGRRGGGTIRGGHWDEAFNEAAWQEFVGELNAAADEARPKLEALESELAAKVADVTANLDLYVS